MGGFRYYSSGETRVVKKGPATLSVGHAIVYAGNGTLVPGAPNPFTIEEGRLLLAANDAFSRTNEFTLVGGVLDAGTATNRLGVLTLDGSASIAVGDGQLTFSDSSSATWAAGTVLSVTGTQPTLEKGHLRFLREGGGQGLSAAQLAAVRYNGDRHVKLDEDGWLYSYTLGVTISFK